MVSKPKDYASVSSVRRRLIGQNLVSMDVDLEDNPQAEHLNDALSSPLPHSEFYIETVPHPHNQSSKHSIIRLDSSTGTDSEDVPLSVFIVQPASKPWAPFRTRADFEYAESVVLSNLGRKWIDTHS